MVNPVDVALPRAALLNLHQWLRQIKFTDTEFVENQTDELKVLCHSIVRDFQQITQNFKYPEPGILLSKPGHRINNMRSGLLLMGQDSATPIHDHGNCFSLSLVLRGTVQFTFYRELMGDETNGNCRIEKHGLVTVDTNQFSCLLPQSRLLHQLTTLDDSACMLDVLFQTTEEKPDQFWYLPLTSDHENPVHCHKLAESEFITISKQQFPGRYRIKD